MDSNFFLDIKVLNPEVTSYYKNITQYDDDSGVDLYFPEDVIIPPKNL